MQDVDARTSAKQSKLVAGFIDKMTTDISATNLPLATNICNWLAVKPAGKPLSEGMEELYTQLAGIDIQAKAGKADLSKVQLEGVIVYVVKRKLPPRGRKNEASATA